MGMFDFSVLQKSMETVGGQLKSIRETLEKLRREYEDIANAPTARSDVKAAIAQWVASKRAEYLKAIANNFAPVIEKPSRLVADGNPLPITIAGGYHQLGGVPPTAAGVDMALCALLGPAMAEGMCKLVDELQWPKEGMPMAKRTAKLEALAERIGDLEREEAEIIQTARGFGVILE